MEARSTADLAPRRADAAGAEVSSCQSKATAAPTKAMEMTAAKPRERDGGGRGDGGAKKMVNEGIAAGAMAVEVQKKMVGWRR